MRRKGFTYIEVIMSLAVISTAVVASLKAYTSFALGRRQWEERAVGAELAMQLMSDITGLPFSDPSGGTAIGIDTGELATNKLTFDDVDDFNGWSESPPQDRSGNPMSAYTGWKREVLVEWDTSLATTTGAALPAQMFKRITVTVSRNGKPVAQLVSVRGSYVPS